MKHLSFLILAAFVLGASAAQVTSAPAGAEATAAPAIVHMKDFKYDPATLTVAPGTKVTFVNDDDVQHSVTATDKKDGKAIFDSGELDKGGKWTRTFASAGTFAYFCDDHSFMKGKIVVKE